jgi:DNA processing protein
MLAQFPNWPIWSALFNSVKNIALMSETEQNALQEAGIELSAIGDPGEPVINKLIDDRGYVGARDYLRQLLLNQFNDSIQTEFNYWLEQLNQMGKTPPRPNESARLIATLAKLALRLQKIDSDQLIARNLRPHIQIILQTDSDYPSQYHDLGVHRPILLYAKGNLSLLNHPRMVAIVGTRSADPYGKQTTLELASDLVAEDYIIVSGGAIGIDQFAHRGSLGRSIAILAGGHSKLYPEASKWLLEENLRQGGLALWEMPVGAPPAPPYFLLRNRLIAALAQATVIVQASWRSGALNTAQHALELNRPLGAIPGDVNRPQSLGTNQLIMHHKAELVTNAETVVSLISLDRIIPDHFNQPKLFTDNAVDFSQLEPDEQVVISQLKFGRSQTCDQILPQTHFSVPEILRILTRLEQKQLIQRSVDGYQLLKKRQ